MRRAKRLQFLLAGLLTVLVAFAVDGVSAHAQAAALAAPDLTLRKQHTIPFVVGQFGIYHLVVTNVGTAATSGAVTVRDTLPYGLAFSAGSSGGAGWTIASLGQVVSASYAGSIAVGDSAKFDLEVSVPSSAFPSVTNSATVSTAGDANPSNDRSVDPTAIVGAPDLIIDKRHITAFVVGQQGAYKLVIRNIGPASSSSVTVVRDSLPAGLSFTSASGSGWVFSVVGQIVVATLASSIAAGDSTSFNLTVSVGANAFPSVINSATVVLDGDANSANNSDSDPTSVTTSNLSPDLALRKYHSALFVVGQSQPYHFVVTNIGGASSSGGITVRDTLPAGLTFSASGSGGAGWITARLGSVITATYAATLAAGDSAKFDIQVNASASASPSKTNSATVYTAGDANPANDRAVDPTVVMGVPDLTIDKRHTAPFVVGQTGSYTIVVTNIGTAATSGTVVAADSLPAGLSLLAVSGSGWGFATGGPLVTAVRNTPLAPGDSAKITLDVSVGANAMPSVTNTAQVFAPGDVNFSNDRDSDPTSVTVSNQSVTPPSFLLKWGSFGSGPGQFYAATGVATDAAGNVYVVDHNNDRIQKFTPSGGFLAEWGAAGSGTVSFSRPVGIATDKAGNVYVTEQFNSRVLKCTSAGVLLLTWGTHGSGNGQFSTPSGIATDDSGHVYVCDQGNNRIQKFTDTGAFRGQWGSTGSGIGQFLDCVGIATDAAGSVYVCDLGNNRIQKFTSNGSYLMQWGSAGGGPGQFSGPGAIATDPVGYVYVEDINNFRVQRFSNSGIYLAQWGSSGSGDGQFQTGGAVATDGVGNIYVSETSRIQKFGSVGTVTTTTLSSSVNPGVQGQTVTFTATVAPPGATGSVTFNDNGVSIGSRPLVNGVSTMSYVLGAIGARTIAASYSGDPVYAASSTSITQTIWLGIPVAVAITPSSNPVNGRSVAMNVSVTPAAATGTILLTDNAVSYATLPLVNGVASFPYFAPAFGVRTFGALYSGDSVNTGASAQVSVSFTGLPVLVTLGSDQNPAPPSVPIALTATVTATSSSLSPRGLVSFFDGSTPIGTLALVAGSAQLVSQFSAGGNHTLSASYSGDTTFVPGVGLLSLVVGATSSTTTTLTSSSVSISEGSTVLFTAAVSPPPNAGNVVFYVDGAVQANVPVASGEASFATSSLTAGTHQVSATYLGAPGWALSTSNLLTEYVIGNQTPVLRVYSPNGGDVLTVGGVYQVLWNAADTHSSSVVWIYASRSVHPPVWDPIATNVPNTGSYLWTVTAPESNGLIAVVDQSGRAGADASDLPFSITASGTETALAKFEAEPSDAGIQVTWALANRGTYSSVVLQRSLLQDGPWAAVTTAARIDGNVTVQEDAAVETGATYWYRLLATTEGGAQSIFGPVGATAGAPKEFQLSGAWPNPSRAGVTIGFAVAKRANVSISLLDIAGRQVRLLASGERAPGRYTLTWDGRDDRGAVPAGVYFVRYTVPGRSYVSRVAIVR